MKKLLISLLIVFVLSVGCGSYFLFFKDKITVGLNGDKEYIIRVNNYQFKDDGIYLKNRDKLIDSSKYQVERTGNVNFEKLGTYQVEYIATYNNKIYKINRDIKIIDDIPPTLYVNLDEISINYCTKKISKDLTYKATDNYDGDITDKIELIKEEDRYTLKVKDSSDNEAIKEIKVKYLSKPSNTFKLIGNTTVYVPLNSTYSDSGVKYTDGCGNKLEGVNTSGEVNTSEVGTYKITYSSSEGKSLSRSVIVYDPTVSKPGGNKVIYLTFDDGPGYYTSKILDTLDKYNIKATFFVTNQFPSYVHLIKTEYEKGHQIAVHTYTHQYSIYTSVDTYLDDFNRMNEVIKSYTGSYSRLFRFPGGSSNTVSRSYNRGIMTELARRMTEDGYVYFDWNVSSGDAAAKPTTDKIISNTINGVKKCNQCVVLMHDIKSYTANALDTILNSFVASGYTFATLNESSPTAHHSINN